MDRSPSASSGQHAGAALRMFVTALCITVADQVVKKVVTVVMDLGQSIDFLGSVVRFTRMANTGAAFGMMKGRSLWFVIVSAVASVAIMAFHREIAKMRSMERLAFGLILGGAVGNLIDRLRVGAVIDFIDIGVGGVRWPAFNVADSAITIGVTILAFHLLFRPRLETRSGDGLQES